MGRQVLWGGAGKMPPREVMNAAAKAARSEMMERIRENKASQDKPRKERGEGGGRSAQGGGGNGRNGQGGRNGTGQGQQARNGNGAGNGRNRPQHGNRPPQHHQNNQPRPQPVQVRDDFEGDDRDEDRMPRNVDPLRTNLPGRRDMTGVKRVNSNGQPDPTRTSIDSMGATRRERSRGNGGGGQRGGQRSYGGR
jgi:ATP-dependent RNA helicase RhlE